MFTRWLLTILPADMRAGWRLVSANLALWIGLATLTALSAPIAASFPEAAASGGRVAVGLAATLLGLAKAIATVPLFDDAFHQRNTDWPRAASLVLRRSVPFVLCVTLTVGGSLIVADVVMAAVTVILKNTPLSEPMVPAFGILIYVTLLVRFAFIPPLVVLRTLETLPRSLRRTAPLLSRLPTPAAKAVWPFSASAKLTEGIRWRLAPYLGLTYFMRLAGRDLSDEAQAFYTAATVIVDLTAQAVLFSYYSLRVAEIADGPE